MQCADNKAITMYKMEADWNSWGHPVRYVYECCDILQPTKTISRKFGHSTGRTHHPNHGNTGQYLDRQIVKCPGANQIINRIQMRSDWQHIWYDLTCYEIGNGLSLDRFSKNSATFVHYWHGVDEMDGVEISCRNGDYSLNMYFLVESRFYTNDATDRAYFNLHCGRIH